MSSKDAFQWPSYPRRDPEYPLSKPTPICIKTTEPPPQTTYAGVNIKSEKDFKKHFPTYAVKATKKSAEE